MARGRDDQQLTIHRCKRLAHRSSCTGINSDSYRRGAAGVSRVERGEEILITKRSKPVALLSPYHPPRLTPERQAAIDHAIEVMAQGLPWGAAVRTFTRDELHDR